MREDSSFCMREYIGRTSCRKDKPAFGARDEAAYLEKELSLSPV